MRTFIFLCLVPLAGACGIGCAVGNGASAPGSSPSAAGTAPGPSRTAAHAKLDSRLLDALDRVSAGAAPASDRNPLDVDQEGRVLVDLTATVTPLLLEQIEAAGGLIVSQFPQYDAIRARLPLHRLLTVAELAAVKSIRPADEATTNPSTGIVR